MVSPFIVGLNPAQGNVSKPGTEFRDPRVDDVTRTAWIDGDSFDLQGLAERFQEGETRIGRQGCDYYVTSSLMDAAHDDLEANAIAAKVICRMNALGRLSDPNFRSVMLSRYTDDSGKSHVVGAMAATVATVRMSATGTVTHPDETSLPAELSPWPDYLALAERDPAVGEALDIITRTENLGWDSLYKMHEIVRDAIRPDKIHQRGWATQSRRFGVHRVGEPARRKRTRRTPRPQLRLLAPPNDDDRSRAQVRGRSRLGLFGLFDLTQPMRGGTREG